MGCIKIYADEMGHLHKCIEVSNMNIQVSIIFDKYVQCYTYVFVMFKGTDITVSMFITIYADDRCHLHNCIEVSNMNIQVSILFHNYVQCYTYVFVMFISNYINVSMFITIYADDRGHLHKCIEVSNMNIQVSIRFDNYVQCYTYVFVMFISTYINVSMFITIYADY